MRLIFIKYLIVSIFIIINIEIYSNIENNDSETLKYHLAFSINPSQNSGYLNFAIIGFSNGKHISTRFISHIEFILVGMGLQSSEINNLGDNLFEKHNIKECLYKFDSIQCITKNELKLFDLWTLRYNRNPYCPPDCIPGGDVLVQGFGQHRSRPSWPQLQILQQYGIIYINDFFYGDNMFKLLSDFQKPNWREKYINSTE